MNQRRNHVERKNQKNNGFIYVASCNEKYLQSAEFSAQTLRDYWPEANITLFTENSLYRSSLEDTFDNVILGIPNNTRAKLWALSHTPYKNTVYLDADVEIVHEDIRTIFDQFTPGTDMMMTRIRSYNSRITEFPAGELTHHCGMFMYRTNKKTINFMKQWWNLWQEQENGTWKWDTKKYVEELRPWDQWTFWWLQNKTEHTITTDFFEDDARWNFIRGYMPTETKKPIVIFHHSVLL